MIFTTRSSSVRGGGGNGARSFPGECVPNGGPDGGNGGREEAPPGHRPAHTPYDIVHKKIHVVESGENGGPKNMTERTART